MDVLRLNKKIYKQAVLDKAIQQYQGVAHVSYKILPEYFEITFSQVEPEVGEIVQDEFANYVLGLHS